MTMRRMLVPTLLLTLAAACGAGQPPTELRDARSAYDVAAKGPAGQEDPASLHTARQALDRAERSFADAGDSRVTRDLSYIALRRAQLADASGRTSQAMRAQQAAQVEAQTLERSRLAAAQTALESTKQSLAKSQEQLESERRARAEAEKRSEQAMNDLKKIASVKQETRGVVITLSGSVLFATNQAQLLPAAISRINEVADALTRGNPDATITIEGHTDSQGTHEHNVDLSERRAQAVKDQLVSHGVAADRIKTVGIGPDRPIASNKTPEGRANNRRVEIVVQPQQQQQDQQQQDQRGGPQTP
jgi:outer membrane protein OmpA-like peptidoglycan-associated protein